MTGPRRGWVQQNFIEKLLRRLVRKKGNMSPIRPVVLL